MALNKPNILQQIQQLINFRFKHSLLSSHTIFDQKIVYYACLCSNKIDQGPLIIEQHKYLNIPEDNQSRYQ